MFEVLSVISITHPLTCNDVPKFFAILEGCPTCETLFQRLLLDLSYSYHVRFLSNREEFFVLIVEREGEGG